MNDERLADVVETQNFASLRVEERYSVPWQVGRVSFLPALAGYAVSVSPFSCESEVPFGQSTPRFFVIAVVVGRACCFR